MKLPIGVKCINQIKDNKNVYCLPGKIYDICNEYEDKFEIDCELNSSTRFFPMIMLLIKKNDPRFKIVYKNL